jgi:hypothetical protein
MQFSTSAGPPFRECGRHEALSPYEKMKNPLQGWLDIGILYSPNSRLDVLTNHLR